MSSWRTLQHEPQRLLPGKLDWQSYTKRMLRVRKELADVCNISCPADLLQIAQSTDILIWSGSDRHSNAVCEHGQGTSRRLSHGLTLGEAFSCSFSFDLDLDLAWLYRILTDSRYIYRYIQIHTYYRYYHIHIYIYIYV